MTYIEDFVERKLKLADALDQGLNNGSYSEAILIISCLLSSFASEVWPGKKEDKRRFVEIIANHIPSQLSASLISIPLLVQSLRKLGDSASVKILEDTNRKAFSGHPSIDSLVIRGSDVDLDEVSVKKMCPHL